MHVFRLTGAVGLVFIALSPTLLRALVRDAHSRLANALPQLLGLALAALIAGVAPRCLGAFGLAPLAT